MLLPEAERQRDIEQYYSRKMIDKLIAKAIKEDPGNESKVMAGVQLLEHWIDQDYYPKKNDRLEQLRRHDLVQLVRDIFVGVAYCQTPELFVSVTSQLASKLKFDDRVQAITAVAEVTAVLCNTDAFDIIKETPQSSLMIKSNLLIPNELLTFIDQSQYLPPLVMEPLPVESNYQSPYLTLNDSLVLGKNNHHEGDLALDAINTQNRVPLSLCKDFLQAVPEQPTHALDTVQKLQLWEDFRNQSYRMYLLMYRHGNRFWFHNKVDNRGRLYAQGYHITPQGTPYKKAMLEFADAEVVEGVPDEYRI